MLNGTFDSRTGKFSIAVFTVPMFPHIQKFEDEFEDEDDGEEYERVDE